jgi:hypothetical protein
MRFALVALALAALALTTPARAYDIEYGTGAICNTENQAERLAVLSGNEDATTVINTEEGGGAVCAVESVAFVRGAVLGTARSKAEAFAVVEILVVGADLGNGYRSVQPKVYFMLDKIDERDV